MSSSALSVNNNVTVRCINKYGKLIRVSRIHNKATAQMVQGLLMFLRGDFTPTLYNPDTSNINLANAQQYVPVEIRLGNPGIVFNGPNGEQDPDSAASPALVEVNPESISTPSFMDISLQKEMLFSEIPNGPAPFKFESAPRFTPYIGFTNDSLGVKMNAYFSPGQLVQRKTFSNEDPNTAILIPYTSYNFKHQFNKNDVEGWSFYDYGPDDSPINKWETLITELGLYTSTGLMLARVSLNGSIDVIYEDNKTKGWSYTDSTNPRNPIVQDQDTSIIIEWEIGIVSIGQEDN